VAFGQAPGHGTSADSWTAGVVGVAPFIDANIDLGPVRIAPGLRVDAYLTQASRQTPRVGETPPIGLARLDAEIEPFVSVRLRATPRLTVFAAAGIYSQPPDPVDLSAVFGNPTLGPAASDQVAVGQSLQLSRSLMLETVAYYRWESGLASRNPATSPELAAALLPEGVGRAYGLQWLLRQQAWSGFLGWISYTVSRSERRDSPQAGWRLFDYDQPHSLVIVGTQRVREWTAGLRFRYATGLPRTPVVGATYDAKDDVYQPTFGPQNTIRLPDFWQIDVRLDRTFNLGESSRVVLYVEGLNVTNHLNAEELTYSVDYTRRGVITGLPALAVVGARVDL